MSLDSLFSELADKGYRVGQLAQSGSGWYCVLWNGPCSHYAHTDDPSPAGALLEAMCVLDAGHGKQWDTPISLAEIVGATIAEPDYSWLKPRKWT